MPGVNAIWQQTTGDGHLAQEGGRGRQRRAGLTADSVQASKHHQPPGLTRVTPFRSHPRQPLRKEPWVLLLLNSAFGRSPVAF